MADLVPGDIVICEEPRARGQVTHSYAAGRNITARPYKGGTPVPAWLIVWIFLDGPKLRHQGSQFCGPEDIVKLADAN